MDYFDSFWQGKLSPMAGIVREIWTGTDYNNDPVTPKSLAKQSTTPMVIQTIQDIEKNPNAANIWLTLIMDGIGFSTNTPRPPKPPKPKTPKGLTNFKFTQPSYKYKSPTFK
jgi:hypothetical protein